jgi:hypothetical protein
VATIIAQPFTDANGRTVSISYSTKTVTNLVVESPVSQSGTSGGFSIYTFSATWTTFGRTLTWPTTYLAFTSFGLEPLCTGTLSSLSLPAATPVPQLIFPQDEAFTALSQNISSYLESLNLDDHGVDLTKCSFAISGNLKEKIKRWWDTPYNFDIWADPVVRRATISDESLAMSSACSSYSTTTVYITETVLVGSSFWRKLQVH